MPVFVVPLLSIYFRYRNVYFIVFYFYALIPVLTKTLGITFQIACTTNTTITMAAISLATTIAMSADATIVTFSAQTTHAVSHC